MITQVIGQLKVLMRSNLEASKFDKEKWSTELSPILNLWKKLNQVSLGNSAPFLSLVQYDFSCEFIDLSSCEREHCQCPAWKPCPRIYSICWSPFCGCRAPNWFKWKSRHQRRLVRNLQWRHSCSLSVTMQSDWYKSCTRLSPPSVRSSEERHCWMLMFRL